MSQLLLLFIQYVPVWTRFFAEWFPWKKIWPFNSITTPTLFSFFLSFFLSFFFYNTFRWVTLIMCLNVLELWRRRICQWIEIDKWFQSREKKENCKRRPKLANANWKQFFAQLNRPCENGSTFLWLKQY